MVDIAKEPSADGASRPLVAASEIGVDPEALWQAADRLRGSLDAAEYKHVVLGLIFLKYVSDAFETRRLALESELTAEEITGDNLSSLLESRDEYAAENVFWLSPPARWTNLQASAKQPNIAALIDEAMLAGQHRRSS